MGGSSSKQTATATTNMMTNIVSNATANCITALDGTGNYVIVAGSDNNIDSLTQSVSISVNPGQSGCTLDGGFTTALTGAASGQLGTAANTASNNASQLFDWNATTQTDTVTNNITTAYSINNTMNCLTSANGQNVVVVAGSGNTIDDVEQQVSEKVTINCVDKNPVALNTAYNVTSAINQSNTYSASVLGNLSDVFSAIFSKAGIIAIFAFILLVAAAVLYNAHMKSVNPNSGASGMPGATVGSGQQYYRRGF